MNPHQRERCRKATRHGEPCILKKTRENVPPPSFQYGYRLSLERGGKQKRRKDCNKCRRCSHGPCIVSGESTSWDTEAAKYGRKMAKRRSIWPVVTKLRVTSGGRCGSGDLMHTSKGGGGGSISWPYSIRWRDKERDISCEGNKFIEWCRFNYGQKIVYNGNTTRKNYLQCLTYKSDQSIGTRP